MRYREVNLTDLDRARAAVAEWRQQNPAGTEEQMVTAIRHRFPRGYDTVLRCALFAHDRHRARQITGVITGPAAVAGR